MPLSLEERQKILEYCDRDLPEDSYIAGIFNFIDDTALRERVQSEYYAARYIYKLGEALNVNNERLHAHVKFQIVQYASIYEAIIVHFLWTKYQDHDAVTSIEIHETFRRAATLPNNIQITTTSDEEVFLCISVKQKTPRQSIKFDDKVDAAVKIGFIDHVLGEEIKGFYKLRNAIHLESAVKNEITYELANSLLSYRRMYPFTKGIKGFLQTGNLPDEARPKKQDAPADSSGNVQPT